MKDIKVISLNNSIFQYNKLKGYVNLHSSCPSNANQQYSHLVNAILQPLDTKGLHVS